MSAPTSTGPYRFASHDDYMKWCEAMVTKIYYAQIALNEQSIRDAVAEIGSKLWLPEGVEMLGCANTQCHESPEYGGDSK